MRRIKIITDVLQALAIVCAGVWAIYTFSAKREASLAEAQREKLALENAQAEKKARDSLVKGELITESVQKTNDGYVIVVSLHITNKGAAAHELKLDDRSVRLARVDFTGKDQVGFNERRYTSLYGLPLTHPDTNVSIAGSLVIRSGADSKYICFFRVTDAGIYYAEFKAAYDDGVIFSAVPVFVGLSSSTPMPSLASPADTHRTP